LASSTEKEVLKVVFKVSKEVSKISEYFKNNIVLYCCFQKNIVATKNYFLPIFVRISHRLFWKDSKNKYFEYNLYLLILFFV